MRNASPTTATDRKTQRNSKQSDTAGRGICRPAPSDAAGSQIVLSEPVLLALVAQCVDTASIARPLPSRSRTLRKFTPAILGLFSLLVGCTALFDTELPLQRDAGVPQDETAACCTGGSCTVATVAACDDFGGEFFEGEACEDITCGPSCESYCLAYEDTCSAIEADYSSVRACTDFCEDGAQWAAGSDGDQAGNTVGCRIYHTEAAAAPGANVQFHCRHAGITGDRICGSLCENYCHLVQSICTGDNAQYASFETCTEQCQGLTPGSGIPDDGVPNDTTGNTIQCRMYHATVGYLTEGQATHCPHSGFLSTIDTCAVGSTTPER